MRQRIALLIAGTGAAITLLLGSMFSLPRELERGALSGVAHAQQARSTSTPAADGEGGVLRIKNQSPFLVTVYAGGVKVGWLRPYRLGLIRGLVNGYQRMFAHSQYATTSWGPSDILVPGTWNLIY